MSDALPTDADALALCRQRLHVVTEAIQTYLEAIEETGAARQATFERYLAVRNAVGVHGPGTAEHALRFIEAYAATLPTRGAAVAALAAALSTDWRTAILCDAEMSDADRRRWLHAPAQELAELGPCAWCSALRPLCEWTHESGEVEELCPRCYRAAEDQRARERE